MAIDPTNSDIKQPTNSRMGSSVWGGPLVVGLLITLLGCLALASVGITSLISVLFYGSLLMVTGIAEIIHAFRVRRTRPFFLFLLGGVLSIVVGALVLARPGAGLAAMTLLLAGYFLATGLFHAITSLMDRYPRWGWDFADGIVCVGLGVVIMAQWPLSKLWAVGIVVGVGLISRGIALMAGSLTVRSVIREAHVS
ncbi:MAG TPA: HdeD family acid-resistance protein [Hyalangium sp.]|nr:HdeD family acid-resistance protein [Hyalangium sp.]